MTETRDENNNNGGRNSNRHEHTLVEGSVGGDEETNHVDNNNNENHEDEVEMDIITSTRFTDRSRILIHGLTILSLLLSLCVAVLAIALANERATKLDEQQAQPEEVVSNNITTASDVTSGDATAPIATASTLSVSRSFNISWLPLPSSDTILTKVAFGSCSRQDMPQPYWDTLLTNYRPDLVVLMGDNIYGDCHEETCAHLTESYHTWASHPSLQGFSQSIPVFATLDDHDYGTGDCDGTNPYKDIARSMFADFFGLSTEHDLPDDGVYRSAVFGPEGSRLQVILLDIRYNRSPFLKTDDGLYTPADDSMQQHMMSEAEWAWFEYQLVNVTADLRVIVSSIQVVNDVLVYEGWRHLPKERARLYDLLATKNVLLVSGDRHIGGFYETDEAQYGIREVTASAWTHTIPIGGYGSNCTTAEECDEVDPRRIGPFVRDNNFGSLEIDWDARTYTVALRRAEASVGEAYHGSWTNDAGTVLMLRNYTFKEEE